MPLLLPHPPVIRYDLEFLGLCPCLVDVEIVDAKSGGANIVVEAGLGACTCGGGKVRTKLTYSPCPYLAGLDDSVCLIVSFDACLVFHEPCRTHAGASPSGYQGGSPAIPSVDDDAHQQRQHDAL